MTDDGKLAEENNTAAELIKMYNNNLTLTRDKLPDFTHLASSIKDTEEKSADSKRMIAQRLTARRRKKILLKQNRKRPLREFSAAFYTLFAFQRFRKRPPAEHCALYSRRHMGNIPEG